MYTRIWNELTTRFTISHFLKALFVFSKFFDIIRKSAINPGNFVTIEVSADIFEATSGTV